MRRYLLWVALAGLIAWAWSILGEQKPWVALEVELAPGVAGPEPEYLELEGTVDLDGDGRSKVFLADQRERAWLGQVTGGKLLLETKLPVDLRDAIWTVVSSPDSRRQALLIQHWGGADVWQWSEVLRASHGETVCRRSTWADSQLPSVDKDVLWVHQEQGAGPSTVCLVSDVRWQRDRLHQDTVAYCVSLTAGGVQASGTPVQLAGGWRGQGRILARGSQSRTRWPKYTLGDVDQDGFADLICLAETEDGHIVQYLRGRADGSLTAGPVTFSASPLSAAPSALSLHVLSCRAMPCEPIVVARGWSEDSDLGGGIVWVGRRGQPWRELTVAADSPGDVGNVSLLDLDSDGELELVLNDPRYYSARGDSPWVIENRGQELTVFEIESWPVEQASSPFWRREGPLYDLDGDGVGDLLGYDFRERIVIHRGPIPVEPKEVTVRRRERARLALGLLGRLLALCLLWELARLLRCRGDASDDRPGRRRRG